MISTRQLSTAIFGFIALTGSQIGASPLLSVSRSDQVQKPLSVSNSREGNGLNFRHQEELFYDLGGASFFSPNIAQVSLSVASGEGLPFDQEHAPVTVVTVPACATAGKEVNLPDIIRGYLESDDLLGQEWLSSVILFQEKCASAGACVKPTVVTVEDISAIEEEYGTHTILLDSSITLEAHANTEQLTARVQYLPVSAEGLHGLRGPYLTSRRSGSKEIEFLPVFKLESDTYQSFMHGVYPVPGGSYRALHSVDDRGYNLIPLPSRLYSHCKEDDGICGQRIAVKDIYDLEGDVTSGGSQNWADLYGKANDTAMAIKRLANLGGVIVGKTKTAMFAMGSSGHEDTVVIPYPWSARADGWQTCVGSSSGSGCAMGAYQWLDLAIGSDTSGSVRGPAATVGLYGNRPSVGIISLEGVIPLEEIFDTAGVLARDPKTFSKFTKSWYADSPISKKQYSSFPKRILVPVNLTEKHTAEAKAMTEAFIQKLSDHLGAEVVALNLIEELKKKGWSTERYQEEVMPAVHHATWWSWDHVGKKLHEDYAARNDGRSPLIDPLNRRLWRESRSNTTREDYHKAVATILDFREAMKSVIGQEEESCTKSLVVYDFGHGGQPVYREKGLNLFNFTSEDEPTTSLLGHAGGCADTTVPIGQVPFISAVSEIEEMKALTVNLVVHAGCDEVLADIISSLAEANILRPVKTGRTAY